jgi:hypothetical protein
MVDALDRTRTPENDPEDIGAARTGPRERWPMYGGGIGELGVGRGQIELLAALFHADAPKDAPPSAYNEYDPPRGLPASPRAPRPRSHRLPLGCLHADHYTRRALPTSSACAVVHSGTRPTAEDTRRNVAAFHATRWRMCGLGTALSPRAERRDAIWTTAFAPRVPALQGDRAIAYLRRAHTVRRRPERRVSRASQGHKQRCTSNHQRWRYTPASPSRSSFAAHACSSPLIVVRIFTRLNPPALSKQPLPLG